MPRAAASEVHINTLASYRVKLYQTLQMHLAGFDESGIF